MAFNPTNEQRAAIETAGGVLVSAAAGSGKTAVLVERVIRLLCDKQAPVSADRLLIVTFTNAAAAEMRERIENRLLEECRRNPLDAGLIRQRRLISSAKICTIDSFCIDLVRENFEKCGVEPDFKVSDGSDLREIDIRVMNELITEQIEKNTPEFARLLELTSCERDEKNLTERINEVYLHSMQMPSKRLYLESLWAPYTEEFNATHPWYKAAFEIAGTEIAALCELVPEMLSAAAYLSKNADKAGEYVETIGGVLEMLRQALNSYNWDAAAVALQSSAIPRSPSLPKDDSFADTIKSGKDKISKSLKRLNEMFSLDVLQIGEFMVEALPAIRLLSDLCEQYGNRLFEEYKKENTLTFSQTEQLALELLCEENGGAIRPRADSEHIISRFDEVMVDEFQDVNDLQNLLFETLSDGGKKLFVVGDVKQSIYGFRGSNPKNFLDKKKLYKPLEMAEENDKKKIILADNFRSRDGVCEFVNYFFSLFLQGQSGELVYNEEERLSPAASFPKTDAPACELVTVLGEEGDTSADMLKREASAIARYIINTVNAPAFIRDGEGIRRARFEDFSILLGAMKDKATLLSEELKAAGIPVAFSPEAFKESTEVKTFLALLRVIDNPARDVELLTVMLSPIFGFTADELALIRCDNRRASLYSSVIEKSKENRHCAEFLQSLATMRRLSAAQPLNVLVSQLLYKTDYLNCALAMPQGEIRHKNLLKLLRLANDYSGAGKIGIAGFLRRIDALDDSAAKSENGTSGVKIMSMHASKGLQFPICILANLHSQLNFADSIDSVLRSEEFGLGVRYKSAAIDAAIQTLPHKIIAERARINTVDERLRLLYVAMTRAEDRLVMFTSSSNMEKTLGRIAGGVAPAAPQISASWLKFTTSMSDWLLAAALLHPQGEPLRRLCDCHLKSAADDCSFGIIFDKGEAVTSVGETVDISHTNTDIYSALKENLEYSYPYAELCTVAAKASASVIAKAEENDLYAFAERPAFLEKDGLTAAEKGTAAHKIMQFIDMSRLPDIEAEIERLREFCFITEHEAEIVDRAALKRFFESQTFARISKSDLLKREMRFLTEVPVNTVYPEINAEAEVIIQGEVDLCFVENGGVVVLDFKTDRVKDISELSSRYSKQLDIYAAACEKIFNLPVKQKLIYSLYLSDTIEV